MSKTAYLVISDLHFSDKQNNNRYNYNKEILDAVNKLINIITKYRRDNYNVKLLYLGDLIDRSYKDVFKAIWVNNLFIHLNKYVQGSYVTLGNHEFSFYTNNPFWTLVRNVESERVKSCLSKSWAPQGLFDVVHIVDTLQDGNVVFHFNHHPTPVSKPLAQKTNIGLFHKDYAPKGVIAESEQQYKLDIWSEPIELIDNTSILDGYHYAFFGHNHKLYGTWYYTSDKSGWSTWLYHLASLGRPNHTEVNNNFLERNIPAVIVEDGEFIKVEDNKFDLLARDICVNEEVVEKRKEVYEATKEAKHYKEETLGSIGVSDNPIENIKGFLAQSPTLLNTFEEYLKVDKTNQEHILEDRMEALKWI